MQIIISVGSYKGTNFDIMMRMVVTQDEYHKYTEEQWIDRIVGFAEANLDDNNQHGMAVMLARNATKGIEFTETADRRTDFAFVRFMVRKYDMLYDMTHKRKKHYQRGLEK